jgi:large subunit ribosomal protein L30e
MAKKTAISPELTELKSKVKENNVIIGAESVIKALRKRAVKKVFLAANCPNQLRSEIEHYATLVNIPVIHLELNNEDLGIFCKKQFFISVIGISE